MRKYVFLLLGVMAVCSCSENSKKEQKAPVRVKIFVCCLRVMMLFIFLHLEFTLSNTTKRSLLVPLPGRGHAQRKFSILVFPTAAA